MKTIRSNSTKKSIFKMALLACIAALSITGCSNSSEQKVETAKEDLVQAEENLNEANQNLEETRIDSMEYAKFKVEAEIEIAKNNLKIANLEEDMKQDKKDLKVKYEADLETLKKKNSDLKSEVNSNKNSTNEEWEAFKIRFNKEMEELGQSLINLSERNKKKAK